MSQAAMLADAAANRDSSQRQSVSKANSVLPDTYMSAVVDFLVSITASLLVSSDGNATSKAYLIDVFNSLESQETINKFAYLTDISAIFIESFHNTNVSTIALALSPSYKVASSVAIVKYKDGVIDVSKSIAGQVQITSTISQRSKDENDTGASSSNSSSNEKSNFSSLQQYTRHVLAPIIKASNQYAVSSPGTSVDSENILLLQRRVRELDIAFDQCQRGDLVPSVSLQVLPAIEAAAKKTSASALKNCLDKYTLPGVDQVLADISLVEALGATQDQKDEFNNEISGSAKQWPQEITRQTRLVESPFPSSIESEIEFWRDLERKLLETKEQLDENPSVLLTKLVVRKLNRVSDQLIREAEMDLERVLEQVQVSVAFLRDFPIDEVMMATSLHPKLSKTVNSCLQHFAKLKHSKYDFNRAVRLVEVLGRVVSVRVVALLKEKGLMECSFDDFLLLKRGADEVFATWETQYAMQRSTLKDIAKKRNEKLRSIQFDIEPLQQRLAGIFEFRDQHDKLLDVFSSVLSGQDMGILSELNDAYQLILHSGNDVIDITPSGAVAWASSRQLYEKRLEMIEQRITRLLDSQLSAAKSADEMFAVFSTYNPLFFRIAIRNAVNSYRTVLLKNVREDVKRLQEKFRLRYDDSLERTSADLRDIPPLSGRIIWARQIAHQLSALMKKMEDVLGQGWEDHAEGKQLREVCDELRSYLDTDKLYSDWLSDQLRADSHSRYNKLRDFLLLVEDDPHSGRPTLRVNFDERQVVVFKEVRYIEWLLPGMSTAHKVIPSTIRAQSREAYARYPSAMSLQAAVEGFAQAKRGINAFNSQLLAAHAQAVQDLIKEAFGGSKKSRRWVKWDSTDLGEWIGALSNKVASLQERVVDVNDRLDRIDALIKALAECPYSRPAFDEVMNKIQIIVDDMQVRGFSHISVWISSLDIRLQRALRDRAVRACADWATAFLAADADLTGATGGLASSGVDDSPLVLDQTVHEVLLSNQVLYLAPSLEQARSEWISLFHQHLHVITSLPRVVGSRFHVFSSAAEGGLRDHSSILGELPSELVCIAFAAIEEKLAEANKYVNQWLNYQALWDASVSLVVDKVGPSLKAWQDVLEGVRATRMTIDTIEEERAFGPIVINHRQVQNKVNGKYDTWQKELQIRFGAILLDAIRSTHAQLTSAKASLESVYLEGPTRDVIAGVECILNMKKLHAATKVVVVDLESSERLLQRQRYQFPSDWLPVSNASSAYGDFCNVLERRAATMDSLLPSLQAKIREEDKQLSARTDEALAHWEAHRPLDGSCSPVEVLGDLAVAQSQISKLADDSTRTRSAKDAMGMDYLSDDRLSVVSEEMKGFRDAWQAVLPSFERLQALRALPLRDVNAGASRVRKQLDEVTESLRALPARVRSYSAVEFVQETIARIQTFQPVLRDIGTEALKDRHWRGLLQALGITGASSGVTLGAFWTSNPLASRKTIGDILATAQGELALEQFLRDLKEHWQGCDLSLVSREGVKLVAGWEVLFTSLEDNLNSIASLRQSPYFKNVPEIQEETGSWEGRLASLRSLFEVWVEVQRKWVYLRGIFRNPDIKAQLPSQYSKYKTIDNDFVSLMKRVALKPAVLELLQIDNLARQLERQDASMTLIQKALGEYLERQRQIFPRFYFVNNEDLVEIIGNSGEPAKIVSHLSKMFAAILGLHLEASTEGSEALIRAVAMYSREGEVVPFTAPLDIAAGVKEWLADLTATMSSTLLSLLRDAYGSALVTCYSQGGQQTSLELLDATPAQVVVLASQVGWTSSVEEHLKSRSTSGGAGAGGTALMISMLEGRLAELSSYVLSSLNPTLRKKCEHLLTEVVHQRDVTRLIAGSQTIRSPTDYEWLYHMRFYWSPGEADPSRTLVIRMSNASFKYGFEYQGIGERLVQTPLTDRCYLTLTQALHTGFGGNPFGPAGTGKTESVKMLGSSLGRFVLVFNCDSSFDYAAMGRIFAGLCQVGAWGCFDEFNRLEERILSAVSQQILTIQRGLLAQADAIQLLGSSCKLHKDVGIFVTLNPGYAGRSNLPDNLKQLFRAVAMAAPDKKMIAQVMLFSQGVVNAEELAGKVVLLFTFCEEQLSQQPHYDFGLRALKSVLVGAGELKRDALAAADGADASTTARDKGQMAAIETEVLIKSTCDSVLPKLVAADVSLFLSLLRAVFPNSCPPVNTNAALLAAIQTVCEEDDLECSDDWVSKVMQLKQVLDLRHGVMLVGRSGGGKSTAWRTLLKALSLSEGVKGDYFVIDPKSISKEQLYGILDPSTLEWTDGVFTKILRRVCGVEGRAARRSWIVFDGDVDPEWAENLNSVLDDNKVLTLPSGDRLKVPGHVRILMEVDSLKYATMATVSRCGMVWLPDSTVALDVRLRQQLRLLGKEDALQRLASGDFSYGSSSAVSDLQRRTQASFLEAVAPHFGSEPCIVGVALSFALERPHVMPPTTSGLLTSLSCLMKQGVLSAVEYNETNSDFTLSADALALFAVRWLLYSVMWAFGGSMTAANRSALSELIKAHFPTDLPRGGLLTDFQVCLGGRDGTAAVAWQEWSRLVPKTEIEPHKITASDVVVATTDTVRHTEVIRAWLGSHKPLILCGPPGSGKTMSLTSVLDGGSDYILASLNFSSGTSPELILKTLAQYCELCDGPEGVFMQPSRHTYRLSQWLVIFCDEINLPDVDKYGTQRVIMFMRQLVEQGGFWGADCKWVTLRRVQFVGACNPPTDAGRKSLSERFLRHAPLLLVDYPEQASLKQIYRCFNAALLRLHSNLKGSVDALNDAMADFYGRNQKRFTPDAAPQYVYSPRELSRWVRAMHEAMAAQHGMSLSDLVRLWAHEGLRLFHDRLVEDADKAWCEEQLFEVAQLHFPSIPDMARCLQKPLLYSSWLRRHYEAVGLDELRSFVAARLRVFYEEELDIPIVLFDEVLDHVLRIDNVLRHPMGHLLLVGESGVGKTVLTRFVSWMNGLAVYQIKASSRYTLDQFDDDLRALLRRVGVDGEKVCFIFDESNVLSSSFLERMNALLASGEIPGLFEGDDCSSLLAGLRDALAREGLSSDSEDELWRRFTRSVQAGLHVVFTMNPASADFCARGGSQQSDRSATSPALYNRCVVDWFGTWSTRALVQVATEFTQQIDVGYTAYACPGGGVGGTGEVLAAVVDVTGAAAVGLHEALVAALVLAHNSVREMTLKMTAAQSGRSHYTSPRDFLDLIRKFVTVEAEKRQSLEEQQTHVQTGLSKLLETQDQVAVLRREMVGKNDVLRAKDLEANSKLAQMVDKQNQAEHRKALAEELTQQLQSQEEQIRVRRSTVEHELSEAEPALVAAKQSVQNIRKQQLDEVRALARPPNAIRLTMEMVAIMIGEKNLEWTELRKVIRRDDFIAIIVNFDPMTLTPKQVSDVQRNYLESAEQELTYERVDTASKACGPLYEWASSQIKYATILRRVKPLRDEVAALQDRAEELAAEQREALAQVAELEEAIKRYKAEYAAAIRATETIRAEMVVVTNKVARAEALLLSLENERERWQASSASFDRQMSTLVGDCLLAAAFLAYAGIFDQRSRRLLQDEWSAALDALGIPHRIGCAADGGEDEMTAYLCRPADLLLWRGQGLPADDLAVQNAILLERFSRYPLVVDPSGQAISFILSKYAGQKMVQTSFLDASFLKTIAAAIRFGNALLVNDVESVDPILNPVLNRELQKTGGRTLIRLGNEDIDFSPTFLLVLATRDPLARFPPDLCSRVTMVNFTITPASLESQVLSAVLRAERPDVDSKRSEILRLQSEQTARLRDLEDSLLAKISAVQGAILDDDTVMNSLEKIRTEASELGAEVCKTSAAMTELKEVAFVYEPLASAMASTFFSLELLAEVSPLYQFSLYFFLEVVSGVLSAASPTAAAAAGGRLDVQVAKERLAVLSSAFYSELSRRVLRSLRFNDKVLFMLRLAQVATRDDKTRAATEAETNFLLQSAQASSPLSDLSAAALLKYKRAVGATELDDTTALRLLHLCALPSMSTLLASMDSNPSGWNSLMASPEPERCVPLWGGSAEAAERQALLRALVVFTLRPDRIIAALDDYILSVFGSSFNWRSYCQVDLRMLVEKDLASAAPGRPVMICSEGGQDASGRVDSLASASEKQLLQCALGSAEGFVEADKHIALACRSGCWVLLRNVHLCPEWLSLLEKKLPALTATAHHGFRLFLACEMSDSLPSSLLRLSEVVIAEASTGVKANVLRFFAHLPAARTDKQPAERCRLYTLLAWFNAVVQERLRYAPLGWTKRYDFSESDAQCALDAADQWLQEASGGLGRPLASHISPEDIPWRALRTLLSQTLYGGRIDQSADQAALDSFIAAIFNAGSYAAAAPLAIDAATGRTLLALPDGLGRAALDQWAQQLPDSNPPTWLGLPLTADKQLQILSGKYVLSQLALLQGLGPGAPGAAESTLTLQALAQRAQQWLAAIPPLDTLIAPALLASMEAHASDAALTPIHRFLAREVLKGAEAVRTVSEDLSLAAAYCNGEAKITNSVRECVASLARSRVPAHWQRLCVSDGLATGPLDSWISKLARRLRGLGAYSPLLAGGGVGAAPEFNVALMFSPEPFFTATRQLAAQMNKWSVEDLELYLDIGRGSGARVSGQENVQGLRLQGGAEWTADRGLCLADTLACPLPPSGLCWRPRAATTAAESCLELPLYVSDARQAVVATCLVTLPANGSIARAACEQRGICLVVGRA